MKVNINVSLNNKDKIIDKDRNNNNIIIFIVVSPKREVYFALRVQLHVFFFASRIQLHVLL